MPSIHEALGSITSSTTIIIIGAGGRNKPSLVCTYE
jgi:hypothetical protein